MRKMLIIIVAIFLLTGCGTNIPKVKSNTDSTPAAVGETQTAVPDKDTPAFEEVERLLASFESEKTVHDPWNFNFYFQEDEIYFFVQPVSEGHAYHATDKLMKAFSYLINWVSEYVPEPGNSKEAYTYDYIFKTNYASDVYYNSQTNTFYFEGEKTLYKAWGAATDFWEKMAFDVDTAAVDYLGDLPVIDSEIIKNDINNDGVPEDISLRAEDDSVYLMINGKSQHVFDDTFQGIRGQPYLHILTSSDKKSKAVIVNAILKSADWGGFEEYYVYRFMNDSIEAVPVMLPEPKYVVENSRVQVTIPQYHAEANFSVSEDVAKYYGEPKEIFNREPRDLLNLREIAFDPDKFETELFITLEDAELLKGGYFYTLKTAYEFKDGQLLPKNVEIIVK